MAVMLDLFGVKFYIFHQQFKVQQQQQFNVFWLLRVKFANARHTRAVVWQRLESSTIFLSCRTSNLMD